MFMTAELPNWSQQNHLFQDPGVGWASHPPHSITRQLVAAGCPRPADWGDLSPISSGAGLNH